MPLEKPSSSAGKQKGAIGVRNTPRKHARRGQRSSTQLQSTSTSAFSGKQPTEFFPLSPVSHGKNRQPDYNSEFQQQEKKRKNAKKHRKKEKQQVSKASKDTHAEFDDGDERFARYGIHHGDVRKKVTNWEKDHKLPKNKNTKSDVGQNRKTPSDSEKLKTQVTIKPTTSNANSPQIKAQDKNSQVLVSPPALPPKSARAKFLSSIDQGDGKKGRIRSKSLASYLLEMKEQPNTPLDSQEVPKEMSTIPGPAYKKRMTAFFKSHDPEVYAYLTNDQKIRKEAKTSLKEEDFTKCKILAENFAMKMSTLNEENCRYLLKFAAEERMKGKLFDSTWFLAVSNNCFQNLPDPSAKAKGLKQCAYESFLLSRELVKDDKLKPMIEALLIPTVKENRLQVDRAVCSKSLVSVLSFECQLYKGQIEYLVGMYRDAVGTLETAIHNTEEAAKDTSIFANGLVVLGEMYLDEESFPLLNEDRSHGSGVEQANDSKSKGRAECLRRAKTKFVQAREVYKSCNDLSELQRPKYLKSCDVKLVLIDNELLKQRQIACAAVAEYRDTIENFSDSAVYLEVNNEDNNVYDEAVQVRSNSDRSDSFSSCS